MPGLSELPLGTLPAKAQLQFTIHVAPSSSSAAQLVILVSFYQRENGPLKHTDVRRNDFAYFL